VSPLRHGAVACLVAVALLAPNAALAEDVANPRAQALFDKALEAARKGDLVAACPLFKASQDVEPRSGTLLNLATCYEKTWRTASAWATYRQAESSARREGRPQLEEEGRKKAELLEPRLVRLTVTVEAAQRVPGLVITVDGAKRPEIEWGLPIPIDPGEHTVTAEAPQRAAWSQTVTLTSDSRALTVPTLAPEKPVSWWTTGRKVGVGVAGAGAATAVVGLVVGAMASSKYSSGEELCPPNQTTGCRVGAKDRSDSAYGLATTSTVLVVAGAAVAAAGGVVVLVAGPPRAHGAAPKKVLALSAAPSWVGLSGQFD